MLPLVWERRAPALFRAPARGGIYVVVSHLPGFWSAEWRPTKGPVHSVLFRVQQQLAMDACARHHTERCTDTYLERTNNEDLAARDLKGPAITSRYRR